MKDQLGCEILVRLYFGYNFCMRN